MKVRSPKRAQAGRPPKFEEARTPVTVTLPLRTLAALQRVDKDRAKAIVKCTDAVASADNAPKGIEVISAFEGFSLIVIPFCPSLQALPRLRLVEITPERFLLMTLGDYSVQTLELELMDIIERLPADDRERALLDDLRQALSRHRRHESLAEAKVLLIDV